MSLKDHRCHCGRLLFKFTAGAVEVKCPRCRVVRLVELASTAVELVLGAT